MMPAPSMEQIRDQRAKIAARLQVCDTVTAKLDRSKTLLAKAATAGPLDAAKLIADALILFMDTQQIQLEQNRAENQEMLDQCDSVLKAMASPIVRPGIGQR